MKSFPRWFIWVTAMTLAAALGLYLYPNEANRVRRQLTQLAAACSFDSGPPKARDLARMHGTIRPFLADPTTLDIAELGESTLAYDELFQGFSQYTQGFSACAFELDNVQVELSNGGRQAVAKGALTVRQVEPSGIRRLEPRRFSATLVKHEGKWLIVHAKITESRLEQPEARP